MSSLAWKRIRVDWEELLDAFEDGSTEHRYYFDRETGAVHFFSEYLDNEDEEEDERAITVEDRYVQIPATRRTVTTDELREFVASLEDGSERRVLTTALRARGGYQYFREAVDAMPAVREEWQEFSHASLKERIEQWLSEVSVEPL
jgi:hypothetical protein